MKIELVLSKAGLGRSLNPVLAFYTYRAGKAESTPASKNFILLVRKTEFEKGQVPEHISLTVEWEETAPS